MSDLVRVRVNGFEKNVGIAFAEKHGLEVLDEPTHKAGRPRGITAAERPNETPATPAEKNEAPTLDAETAEEANE